MEEIRVLRVSILGKIITYIAVFLCILGIMLPITAYAVNDDSETVRVGFFARDGYHIIDEEGLRSGYGYEVYQLISRYSNLQYEYVGYDSTRNESLDMLRNGEIELFTPIHMTDERLEEFAFSEVDIGSCSTMLTVKAGDVTIEEGNYATYDGKRVGMVAQDMHNDCFFEYAAENGFSCTVVYYESTEDVIQALKSGEIDMTVTGSIRVLDPDEWYLESFHEEPIYVATQKENQELMAEINAALIRLDYSQPDWRLLLLEEYYPKDTGDKLNLTQEEKKYIEDLRREGTVFQVLVNPDNYPFAYIEDGSYKGILVEVFDEIARKSDIDYEIIMVESREDYMTTLASGQPDICLDFHQDYSTAENLGYVITDTYLSSNLSLVYRSGAQEDITRVAIIEHSLERTSKISKIISGVEYVVYPSHEEAVTALHKGEVQGLITSTLNAEKIVWDDERNELQSNLVTAGSVYNIGVAVHIDYRLGSILNKAIASLDEELVSSIIQNYSELKERPLSLTRLFYEYPAFFSLFVLVVVTYLLFIVVQALRAKYRKKYIAELEAKEKANQVKSEFLSRMSHDIRTPINGVMGMIEIAKKHIDDKKRVEDCLNKMDISAKHLQSLVNDVLDMTEIETHGNQKLDVPFDIRQVLGHCVEMISSRIGSRKLAFEYDYQSITHPHLIGENLHLIEILINILGNSVKYTKDGGTIKFFAEERVSEKDGMAAFCFVTEDTGIGMSEEFLAKIYEPFEQENDLSRTEYMGTGLGMTIVKKLIDRMGGRMEIESKRDVGSKFTIYLEFQIDKEPKEEQTAVLEEPRINHSLNGMKILVVDDVELNLEILQSILEDEGVTVVTAVNGQEAVEAFKASEPGSLHLILMDVRMPILDGIEATRAIRSITDRADAATIPIVAVSANAYETDEAKSKEAGMNDHLRKPIDTALLMSMVESYKPKDE